MPIEDIYLPEGDFENPLLQSQGYDLLKPTTGQALKAGLGLGQLDAPVNYLRDLDTYNNGPGIKLTPEAANKEYGIPGYLNFDRELAPEAARVVRERTLKRLSFDDVLNRASTAQNVGALGANFVGQMFDPINLATAFVPVTKIPGVSTMMTSLLTKNPFTQRAAIGAVEGTVGQALIEPIYIAGDQLGFEEHTNADVMRNLAFGTIFGAGAHVTLGAGADAAKFLYGKALSTHNVAVEKSILQLMDGGVVNVEPVIRSDKNYINNQILMNQFDNLEATGNFAGPGAANISYGDIPIGLNVKNMGDPTFRPDVPVERPSLPATANVGAFTLNLTPISKTLYRETNADGLANILRASYAKSPDGGAVVNSFVTDNPDLAIGQGENTGVKIEFREGAVSAEVNPKPGTSDLTGLEYKTNFIGLDSVNKVTVSKGQKLSASAKTFLQRHFTKEKLDDGSTAYTRKGLNPIKDLKEEFTTQSKEIGKPLTVPELTAAATAYSQAPSSAASIDTFVPPEAITFNSAVEKTFKPGEKVTNSELEQVIADLEFEAKSVLSKEELASINEANNASVKETDSYIGGLNQAFTCWKNG